MLNWVTLVSGRIASLCVLYVHYKWAFEVVGSMVIASFLQYTNIFILEMLKQDSILANDSWVWDIHEGVDNLPSTCCIIEGIEEFWRGNNTSNLVAIRTPWQLHGKLWNFTFKLWLKAFVRVGKKSLFSFFGQKLNNVIINLSFKNGQNVIK